MTTQNKKNITRLALLFTVCGVLLLAVAVGSLILRCRALEQRLDAAFLESLTAHTLESGESARELIENTQILLGDAVRLLERDGRPLDAVWADPCLLYTSPSRRAGQRGAAGVPAASGGDKRGGRSDPHPGGE